MPTSRDGIHWIPSSARIGSSNNHIPIKDNILPALTHDSLRAEHLVVYDAKVVSIVLHIRNNACTFLWTRTSSHCTVKEVVMYLVLGYIISTVFLIYREPYPYTSDLLISEKILLNQYVTYSY